MNLQHIFTEALRLHTEGRLDEAKEKYHQVLEALPDNVNVLGNIGIVCRDLGQMDEAIDYCRHAVESAPEDPLQYVNLGAVYESAGDITKAQANYEKAIELAPEHPKALNNLGKLHHLQGNTKEARTCLEKAISAEPNYPLALNNIGVLASEQGDLETAAHYLEKSYTLDCQNQETLYNLAGLYNCQKKYDKSKELLEKLLQLNPHHPSAQHMLAAVSGHATNTAPREYVVETFDRYAGRFDEHLQGPLGYNVPSELLKMVDLVRPETCFKNCLDLGCGTGLSGSAFRNKCEKLVGVDISSAMLKRAEQKQIYDRLLCEEVYDYLENEESTYDLIVAADVLIYLGRLDFFFQAVVKRLDTEAALACSIERFDGDRDYALQSSGRYAHRPDYLLAAAKAEGLAILQHKEHGIRKEDNAWISGDLYVLTRVN